MFTSVIMIISCGDQSLHRRQKWSKVVRTHGILQLAISPFVRGVKIANEIAKKSSYRLSLGFEPVTFCSLLVMIVKVGV